MERISAQMTTTNPAVTIDSSQLLPSIFMTAHTAIIGDFIIICSPIATIIWSWVMSFVVRVMRLGTEICPSSRWENDMTLSKTHLRTVKLNPAAVFAAR